ncbi:hypothetical protein [Micromonospora sp.]
MRAPRETRGRYTKMPTSTAMPTAAMKTTFHSMCGLRGDEDGAARDRL